MKTCPYCAEEIQDAASVCRYCGRSLSTSDQAHKWVNLRSGITVFVGVFIAELIVMLIREEFWGKSFANPVDMLVEFYTSLVVAYAIGYFAAGLLSGLMAPAPRARWLGLWVGLIGISFRFSHDTRAGMEITSTYAVIGIVAIGAGALGGLLTGTRRQSVGVVPKIAPAPEPAIHEPSRSAGPVIAILLVLAVVVGGVWLAVDGKNLPSQQASDIQASNATTNVPLADPPTPIPTPSPIPARDFVVALDGWKCSPTQQGQTSFVGQVKNYGRQPIGMVELRVTLLDGQNHEVNSEVGRVNLPTCLKQDETTQFIVRVSDPNFAGKRCRVETEAATFATLGSSGCPLGNSPAAKATAPAGSASSTTGGSLLSTLTRIRKNIQALAQDAEVVHCERNLSDSVLNNYEAVINAPKFNVTGAAQTAAYADYRSAVDIITRTNKDMYLHCSEWVKGTATTNVLPRQTWGTARQGVDQALQAIDAGLAKLK